MEIKPDKKLLTKSWYILLTLSIFILILTLLLHLIPLLDDDVDFSQFTKIIWIVASSSIILMWIVSVPIIKLWIKNLSYHIGDDKITINKGILTKNTAKYSVPNDNGFYAGTDIVRSLVENRFD